MIFPHKYHTIFLPVRKVEKHLNSKKKLCVLCTNHRTKTREMLYVSTEMGDFCPKNACTSAADSRKNKTIPQPTGLRDRNRVSYVGSTR